MFKHTYTSISERYLLNEKIQCYLLDGIDNLMKRIELSLLYNSYPNIDEEKKIDLELNNFKELREALAGDLIKERIRRLNIVMEEKENILNLDQIESKMLLITLYEYYLREEMVEYVDFLDFDKEKNVKREKIEENFKTFINNYKDEKYLEDFDIKVKKLFKDREAIKKIYINRPTYFLLYRIRNNLLREINKTKCSENFIKNSIKQIKRFYTEKYIDEYNKKFFFTIKKFDEMKNEIFKHIEEEFLDWIRNGKTVNAGNELVVKFKNAIQKDIEYNKLRNEYINLIKIEDGYEATKEKYEKLQEKYNKIVFKYLDEKTKINANWIKNDLNIFFSYCTVEYIVDSLSENRIQNIDNCKIKEVENETIEYIKTKIIKKEIYNVFIKIENVDLQQQNVMNVSNLTFIKGKELKINIDKYLQTECTKFEKDFFKLDKIQENDVYVKVEKIEAYKSDSEFICNIAFKKINDIVNLIYFYTARDKSKRYKLGNQLLIIENSNNNKLIKYLTREGIFDIPLVSNEWMNNIFTGYGKNVKLIIEAINEFNKIINENTLDIELLIKSNKKLLNENDVYKLSRDMAILIAGTNIFRYTISYLDLRFWLIEDYIEFFSEELPNDQFIQERFLNFYKRVINIIFSYSDLKRNNLIKDLQNWILKIFPDDYIYKEDRSNNE